MARIDKDKALKDKLLKENKEFQGLHKDHLEYEQKLEKLMKKKPRTTELHFEIETLKKRKLQGKDKMERILIKHR